MSNIQAILFDCDGVIADTEKLYMQSICDTLNNIFNYKLTYQQTLDKFKGMNINQITTILENENVDFADKFDETAREQYRQVPMDKSIAIDGIVETLEALKDVKKAVCSNAQVKSIEKKLDIIDIKSHFDVLVGAGKNPKPHPEVYLKGAFALKADPYRCLAVEDSIVGLKAAIASGAISVAYAPNKQQKQELEALMPDFIITNMIELVELYKNLNES